MPPDGPMSDVSVWTSLEVERDGIEDAVVAETLGDLRQLKFHTCVGVRGWPSPGKWAASG